MLVSSWDGLFFMVSGQDQPVFHVFFVMFDGRIGVMPHISAQTQGVCQVW